MMITSTSKGDASPEFSDIIGWEESYNRLSESELPHVRERILILLLQNDGKTQQEIGQF